ncbi:MAG: hypothetical protein PHY93_00640 [Bacteriovorax sp.]|nr:hypothetical protein [Bacteriovorax sp.]
MPKNFIFFLSLILLFSCGKTTDEKTADAILSANIALSKGSCQLAINILETNGRVNDNAAYLKTLASAYACRAGYSAITFFASDVALTVTPAPLGGMTLYSTSKVAVQIPLQNDPSFKDLQTAINILLYAGGIASTTDPTATERAKYFSASEAADINTQLFFMIMVQLGKYMHVYGDVDAAGAKAGGAGANLCFTSYGVAPAGILAGTCNIGTSSHAQLDGGTVAPATRKTRLCHGVVLFNGYLDLLPSIAASASGSLAVITGATAAINAAKGALAGTVGVVLTTINQTTCEDILQVPVEDIEYYFAGIFEKILL